MPKNAVLQRASGLLPYFFGSLTFLGNCLVPEWQSSRVGISWILWSEHTGLLGGCSILAFRPYTDCGSPAYIQLCHHPHLPLSPGHHAFSTSKHGKGAGTALSYLNVFRLNGSLCKASPPPGLLLPRKEPSWSVVPGPRWLRQTPFPALKYAYTVGGSW